MFTRLTVEIPQSLLLELLGYLATRKDQCSVDRATTDAMRSWLLAQTGKAPLEPGTRGYQWKMLFLPEGTCIQSWSYGEHNYARVVGDQIIHNGHSVTPNQFARSFARTERNAWRDLYIKRPEDKNWQLASRLRQQVLAEQPQAAPTRAARVTSKRQALSFETPTTVEPRCRTQQPGWDLPERRKYRIRLEDFD